MTVGSNNVLKLLSFAVLLSAGVGALWSRHHQAAAATGAPSAPAADSVGPMTLSKDENKKLSADGDTAKDTVATLIAEVKGLKSELSEVKVDNAKLRDENKDLSQMEGNINARLDQKLRQDNDQKTSHLQQTDQQLEQTKTLLQSLEERLSNLHAGVPSTGATGTNGTAGITGASPTGSAAVGQTDVPIGLGLHPGEGVSSWTSSAAISAPPAIVWVDPIDRVDRVDKAPTASMGDKAKAAASLQSLGSNLPDASTAGSSVTDRVSQITQISQKLAQDIPVYTINRDATLIGSVSMTALIGRVPVAGQVQDPYKFKLLVGAENLAANGIKIPGLDAMVISGVATGDWGLSCVRGDITSATFVFQDGTIRSYPKPDRSASTSSGTTAAKKTFGYISDKFGIPCVTGERKSNAVQFLATRIGLAAAQAAAEAAAAAETTTVASGQTGAIASAVTGSPSLYAKNKAISSGIQESSNWVKERQAQSFDAIFVRNGADVAIHVEEEIPIDYEPTGRKVNHHAKLQFAESPANRNNRNALD